MSCDPPDWFTNNAPPDEGAVHLAVANLSQRTATDPIRMLHGPLRGVVFDGDAPLDEPAELVQGMFPADGIAFLGGQSGAGKTFMAVDLAVSVCTQQPFFNRKIRNKVGVAYVAAEGVSTLGVRFEAARRRRDAGRRLAIASVSQSGDLSQAGEIETLVSTLLAIDSCFREEHGCPLGLVIIDTLAAAFTIKDENANGEASATMRSLRAISEATRALVLVVHHYGKSSDTGLRGASAYRAGADAVLSVIGTRDQITGVCRDRSVAVAKSRTGYEGPLSGFDLIEMEMGSNRYGEPLFSCAIEQTTFAPKAKGRPATAAMRLFREAFECASLESGEMHHLNGCGPMVKAVRLHSLREEYLRRKVTGEEDGSTQKASAMKAFRRAIDNLPADFSTETSAGVEWVWQA